MKSRMLAWDFEEPLTDLTFYADWDQVTSMILSLKLYLSEWGAIPIWNFMFCHGRPELAVPYSWAWTWPSVFAYTLPPVHAVFAVWLIMTAIGFAATRALLLRWSGSQLGAAVGAAVYVLGGYFANRLNAGHVPFAFFHWIPLLIYLFEVAFDRGVQGQRSLKTLLGITLTAFLFVSGGLPQPLLYFYPALLLFIAFRLLRTGFALGFAPTLRAASLPIVANLLGFLLAAYKLWPVIAWQSRYPRVGVAFESYSVANVISNTLIFVTDYFTPGQQEPWHVYPAWGYNAFVGPMPWLLAAVAILAAIQRRRRGSPEITRDRYEAFAFGLLLVTIGIALSLGNANPWSPSILFRHFPILDGVRAFNRYQILIVFGLAILTALGFAALERSFAGRARWSRPLLIGLAIATLAPLLAQAFLLVRNIPAQRNAALVAEHALDPSMRLPEYVRVPLPHDLVPGHQTAVLETGNWIGNCYSSITLPDGPSRADRHRGAISFPPPTAIEELAPAHIRMRYPAEDTGRIRLNLRVLEDFEIDAPHRFTRWTSIRFVDLADGRLTLRADSRAPKQGRAASYVGVLLSGVFFLMVARRTRTGNDRRRARSGG